MKYMAQMAMTAAGLLLCGAAAAGPQYDSRGDRSDALLIRCESNRGQSQRCEIGSSITEARLVQKRSGAPCIEGQTWGYERSFLWVSGGCRGEFMVRRGAYAGGGNSGSGDDGRVFRCESRDNRYQQCASESRSRARLVRQLSNAPCIEGRTWGSNRGGVWVDRGCRAEFSSGRGNGWGNGWGNSDGNWGDRPGYGNDYGYGGGQTVRCESTGRRMHQCRADVRRDVRLLRQLSDTRCVEGRNWGWDRRGIWVTDGCRAEFEIR